MRMLRPLFPVSTTTRGTTTTGRRVRGIVGVFLLCYWGSTVVYELHRNVLLQLSTNSNNNNEYYNYSDEPEIGTVTVHTKNTVRLNSTSKFPTTVGTLGVSTITAPTMITTTTTQKKEKEKDMEGGPTKKKKMTVAGEAAVADSDSSNDDSAHFSACILWMDDNYRLEEWLAYHYYVMKLRYVVMAVDHRSRTSPQHIVDRWNDKEKKYQLNMTIVTWTDSEYIHDYKTRMEKLQKASDAAATSSTESSNASSLIEYGNQQTAYHRSRQHRFYRMCSTHLVEQNKTWVSYHDTDEFITYQHWEGTPSPILNHTVHEEGIQKIKQPGSILDALNSIKEHNPPNSHLNDTGVSCVSISRRRYCSNELTVDETNQLLSLSTNGSDNGSGIIPENLFKDEKEGTTTNTNDENDEIYNNTLQRFDTLRYKYITPQYDGEPKSFIDLSQPNSQLYVQNRYKGKKKSSWGTHRPMVGLCKQERKNRLPTLTTLIDNERFIINHYLGSWAAYSFRDDARQGGLRNYQVWLERSTMTEGEYSHVVRPWLTGFALLVGIDAASYLLQEAGKFPKHHNLTARRHEYEHTHNFRSKNQTFMTEKEKEKKRGARERRQKKKVDQESSRAREKQQEQEENERKKKNAVVSL